MKNIKKTAKGNRTCGSVAVGSADGGTSIASLIKPDVKFSAEENRILTQRPKLNPETLKSKSFMEDMESYTSDQFIFRDWWVSLKVRSDMLLGKHGNLTECIWERKST